MYGHFGWFCLVPKHKVRVALLTITTFLVIVGAILLAITKWAVINIDISFALILAVILGIVISSGVYTMYVNHLSTRYHINYTDRSYGFRRDDDNIYEDDDGDDEEDDDGDNDEGENTANRANSSVSDAEFLQHMRIARQKERNDEEMTFNQEKPRWKLIKLTDHNSYMAWLFAGKENSPITVDIFLSQRGEWLYQLRNGSVSYVDGYPMENRNEIALPSADGGFIILGFDEQGQIGNYETASFNAETRTVIAYPIFRYDDSTGAEVSFTNGKTWRKLEANETFNSPDKAYSAIDRGSEFAIFRVANKWRFISYNGFTGLFPFEVTNPSRDNESQNHGSDATEGDQCIGRHSKKNDD